MMRVGNLGKLSIQILKTCLSTICRPTLTGLMQSQILSGTIAPLDAIILKSEFTSKSKLCFRVKCVFRGI